MNFNSINMKVVQMAASNWQLAMGTSHMATDKWLLTTGCLQTFPGKKLVDSKPGKRVQTKGFRPNHP